MHAPAQLAATLHHQATPARVLVVDDARLIRTMLVEYLEDAGYEVETAEDGVAALALLDQRSYDVVITDLHMPAADGFAVLEAVKCSDLGAEVIILTGSHAQDVDAAVRALRLGAQDYLTKPLVGTDQVVLAVEKALEKKRSREALREAQKMEAIGRLAGGIAHDFNNLLGIIAGCAGLMAERTLDERSQRDVLRIQDAVDRASELTRRLLAFGRRQVLQSTVLDLNAVLSGMRDILRSLVGEKVRLHMQLADSPQRIKVDPGQLEQVVVNLVMNARDAMPEGGELTLEIASVEFDGPRVGLVPVPAPGRYVMLAVSDTGTGMDEATRKRVFEPFFTTKEHGHGTGLGLAAVHGVVSQSGGAVAVYSEAGHGSTFKVYLPSSDEELPLAKTEERGATEPVLGSGTVLIVEDQDALREVMQDALEALGYRVLVAHGGQAALDLLDAGAPQIDLLLTDIVMPEMNGSDLARALTEKRPGLKVIYMSGYADTAVSRRGLVPEGAVFLQKPISLVQLSQAVRSLISRDSPDPALDAVTGR